MKKKVQKPLTEEDIQEILKDLGAKLTATRKERGYKNYETFAFENDIPRAQYGRYERGSDLKVSSLLKVLNALSISASEFFTMLEK